MTPGSLRRGTLPEIDSHEIVNFSQLFFGQFISANCRIKIGTVFIAEQTVVQIDPFGSLIDRPFAVNVKGFDDKFYR